MEYNNILDINYTISKELFIQSKDLFKIIPNIKEYIIKLGKTLDKEKFTEIEENIWIANSAKVAPSASISAPCIIDEEADIRHCAYIRGSVIVGKKCVIGNSCEIKNAIIFDESQIPHFNYVGDSILGHHAHLGAGVILSNLKNDKTNIIIKNGKDEYKTGLRKLGAIIGNNVDIGCNSVLNPGTIIYPSTVVYPLTRLRGIIEGNSIVKSEDNIIRKEER